MLLGFFRQCKDKFGTNAFGADHIQILFVGGDDLLADGQTQSGSQFVFSTGEICFIKTLKDFSQIIFGYSDTGIFYGHKYPVSFFPGGDKDRRTFVTEFDSVIHKVVKNLLDLVFVSADPQRFCIG